MHGQEHSTFREGAVTGVIGAVIVAVWYLIVDTANGQPLHTPNVLGKIFFRGDLAPGARQIVPHIVVGYTVFHFVVFALVGLALTLLVHLATRDISLRMRVWIGLVVAFGLFAGLTYMLGTTTGERLSPWAVVSGSLLGVLGMGQVSVAPAPAARPVVRPGFARRRRAGTPSSAGGIAAGLGGTALRGTFPGPTVKHTATRRCPRPRARGPRGWESGPADNLPGVSTR